MEMFNFVESGEFEKYFGRDTEVVRECVKIVTSKASDERAKGIVVTCIRVLGQKIMDAPLDDKVRSFMLWMLNEIKVWNESVGKVYWLTQHVESLERLLMAHYTLSELLTLLGKLMPRIEKILYYTPPSFELSRKYLEDLMEKYGDVKNGEDS